MCDGERTASAIARNLTALVCDTGKPHMDMRSPLCGLVEVLEGTRAMHDDAARSSMGDLHMRHEEKASRYAAMPWRGNGRPDDDGFPALIDRIYRM